MIDDGDPGSEEARDSRAESHLGAAIAAFETFRDELNGLLCEVRLGQTERAKKLAPMVAELARAVNRVADEQVKLDARHGRAGGAGDATVSLDLAAARAEVSRRLAELRDEGS